MAPFATAQFTISDLNDINISTTEPLSPVVDQLWLDTSVVPNQLKRWSGTEWERAYIESFNDIDSEAGNVSTRLSIVEASTQTLTGAIANKVSETEVTSLISDASDVLKQTIESDMAETYLTPQSFGVTIEQINQIVDITEKANNVSEKLETHFDFGIDGMFIKQSDTGSRLFLDAQSVQIIGASSENFVKQDGAVMYITGNNMYIENAEVGNSLKVGNHLIKKLASAPTHTVIKYIG